MGVQVRLPTVILTISPNDVPRSVPVMVTVVPPSVGPLSGEMTSDHWRGPEHWEHREDYSITGDHW